MRSKLFITMGLLIVGLALSLTACQASEPCPECPEPTACPEQPTAEPCPECEACFVPLVAEVPFEAEWVASGHADATAEAFRHWDAEGAVPGSCARCHSASGLPQFLAEGTNITNPTSNGFACTTCHDEENWPADSKAGTDLLYDIDFFDADHGIAVGVNGTVVYTADGGTTWTPGISGEVAGDGIFTFDAVATRKGDYEGFNTWYSHFTLPHDVGIRIIAKDKDYNYTIADTRLTIALERPGAVGGAVHQHLRWSG